MGKLDNSKENPFQTLLFGSNTQRRPPALTSEMKELALVMCEETFSDNISCDLQMPNQRLSPRRNDSHLYMRQHTEIAQRSADCIVRCPTAY